MNIIFTEQFKDLARILAATNGFPADGRIIGLNDLDKNMAAATRTAENFGYITAPCRDLGYVDDVFWTWGSDLVDKKCTFEAGSYGYSIEGKDDIQLRTLVKLFSRKDIMNIYYLNTKGSDSSYFMNLLTYANKDISADDFDFKIRIIDIKAMTQDDIKKAFSLAENDTNSNLRFSAASLEEDLYLMADARISEATKEVCPQAQYPGIKSLPVLQYIYSKTQTILATDLSAQYTIKVTSSAYNTDFSLSAKGLSFRNKLLAEKQIETLPKEATVTKVTQKIWAEYSKGTFTKSRLLEKARVKLGYSYDKTEKVLDSLFSGGYISNPNTNSCRLPQNSRTEIYKRLMTLKDTTTFRDMLKEARPYYAIEPIFSDNNEHGIIITDKRPTLKNPDEIKIYELIFVELIKIYYPPRETSSIHFEAEAGKMKFTGTGRILVKEGFSALEERRPPRQNAPMVIKEGDSLPLYYSVAHTQPATPPYPDIFEIEKGVNLPLDSVKAALSSLEEIGLIIKIKDKYSVTQDASPLIRIYRGANGLLSGMIIPLIQNNVSEYSKFSEAKQEEVKESLYESLSELLTFWDQAIRKNYAQKTSLSCPICEKALLHNESSLFCDSCGFSMFKNYNGKDLQDKELSYLFQYKKTPLISGFDGEYMGRLLLGGMKVNFTNDSDFSCPRCAKKLFVSKKTKEYVCESCGFRLPNEYMNYSLTAQDKKDLLTQRQSSIITIRNDSGEAFNAALIIDRNKDYTLSHIPQEF